MRARVAHVPRSHLIAALALGALAAPVVPAVDPDAPAVAPEDARGWETEPPNHGRSALHAALWVPRVVLFVPRVALAGVFLPIRFGLDTADRTNLQAHVDRLIYWDRDHTYGLVPTASYSSDFGPSGGATLFHDSVFGHDEEAALEASYGGRVVQSYDAHFEAERLAGGPVWLELRGRYERNPRLVYFSNEPDALESRYSQERLLGVLGGGATIGAFRAGAVGIANDRTFGPAVSSGDTSIESVYTTSALPGFDNGVSSLEVNGVVRIDPRDKRGITAVGPHAELFAGPAAGIEGASYLHYGAELAATVHLYRGTRLVSVRAFVDAVDGEPEDIPFSALPRLGGADRLRGYREDRFRDRRALLASLSYSYPVHHNAQAHLFADVGSVGPDFASALATEAWRPGFGGGFLVGSADNVSLRLDAAYGDGFRFFVATDVGRAFGDRSTVL